MTVQLLQGDCRARLHALATSSIDSCVTDPPYELGFMGRGWDRSGVANDVAVWREVFRVLKPGAHLLAFGGTRTYHRMVCAIEDAGFEIRDCIRSEQGQEAWPAWVYATGFPKSHNAAKAIDKHLGREGKRAPAGNAVRRVVPGAQQNSTGSWTKLEDRTYQPHAYEPATADAAAWQGFGTALKPAWEPICVARKPLDGTVAANLLEHGCGALNIDACRVAAQGRPFRVPRPDQAIDARRNCFGEGLGGSRADGQTDAGRWPANLVHDGSDEVVAAFPAKAGAFAPVRGTEPSAACSGRITGKRGRVATTFHNDSGSAARFFYSSKASKADRAGSDHPTVKPLALMRYLVRLVTPPGGRVLDPFAGSGTTGEAAHLEGFDSVLCELTPAYVADIRRRLERVECNIIEARRRGVNRCAVNITPPKAAHNKHYVAPGASP